MTTSELLPDDTHSERWRVLLIEDGPGDAEFVRMKLTAAAESFEVEHCETLRSCLAAAHTVHPDIFLLNLGLPDSQRLDSLRRLVSTYPRIPVVVLTGADDGDLGMHALKAGAQDYLSKNMLESDSLERSLKYAIGRKQMQQLQAQLVQAHDRTARIVHSERLAALGELSAGVAHELNQPLNAIRLISQMLLRYPNDVDTEALTEDLGEILNLVDAMAETIDHMKSFARRDESALAKTIDANAVVGSALRLMGQQLRDYEITLVQNLAEELPPIAGNAVRLELVIVNLLVNARDSLLACEQADLKIEISTRQTTSNEPGGTSHVVIEVRDNGPGVAEDVQRKIFEPFFTTKAPGNGPGLGLSIAASVLKQHGGQLQLESSPEIGAVFKLSLPVATTGVARTITARRRE